MFVGYYGRRRLKTTVVVVFGILVFMALLSRREGESRIETQLCRSPSSFF